jgi:hypothetical protein
MRHLYPWPALRYMPGNPGRRPAPARLRSHARPASLCPLLARWIISRPTQDAGLFTDQEHGVQAAASAMEAALRGAGVGPGRRDQGAGLTGIFPGMGEGLAEWIVIAPGGERWRCTWLITTGAGRRGSRPATRRRQRRRGQHPRRHD